MLNFVARGPLEIPAGGGDSAAYTNFIARTSGLDAGHLAAYKALLDGMTTDGLFDVDGTSDYFDALYVFATQDSTTALLNLVSATFNISTVGGTPDFDADSGIIAIGSGDFLRTDFNPTTASSPKFTQDSAHLSCWNLTNASADHCAIGNAAVGSTGESHIFVKLVSDGNCYVRINEHTAAGRAISDPRGHIIGNRSSSSQIEIYQNGAQLGANVSSTSASPLNAIIDILEATGADADLQHRYAAFSIGGHLSAANADLFYDRLRTYMTAVGVP
jgi:hypothetical protein